MGLIDFFKRLFSKQSLVLKNSSSKPDAAASVRGTTTAPAFVRVLFVCTANICRSAMSEALLKSILQREGASTKVLVESAGIEALEGMNPDPYTVEVCRAHGIDITAHTARQLTDDMIRNASFVLCLAENHKKLILSAQPEAEAKTFLLKEFLLPEPVDDGSIEDPTGQSSKKYEACFTEVQEEITRIAPSLIRRALRLEWEAQRKKPRAT
jgi:protein-tyrosine-phosphatase